MPVTPFHFGVGLLAKGVAPSRVSFAAFAASQIAIDCETAYFLLVVHRWPLHRWAHTFVVGTLVGLAVGFLVAHCAGFVRSRGWELPRRYSAEAALWPALLGGALGGATHPFLDGLMHADMHPLRPFGEGNPFLGLVGLMALHLSCILAGLVGWVLLVRHERRRVHAEARQRPE